MANSVWVSPFGGMSFNGNATTFSFPVLLPDGSASAPALSFVNDPTDGFMRGASHSIDYVGAGTAQIRFNGDLNFASGGRLTWYSGAVGTTADTILVRDAPNTLAQRNATAAQQFNVGPSGNLISLIGSVAAAAPFLESIEGTAPTAGAANTYRLFAQDNGGGKTQLMVIFNTGAAQQIAIQP